MLLLLAGFVAGLVKASVFRGIGMLVCFDFVESANRFGLNYGKDNLIIQAIGYLVFVWLDHQ